MKLVFAFCTYNRASRLPALIRAMRLQSCPADVEILAINNNSRDDTLLVLQLLAQESGAPLRIVTETRQGIVAARNRALAEAAEADILVFIDDDELPLPGTLEAAYHAIVVEGAQCVGGRLVVDFEDHPRPRWLGDELLGFLGALDYGDSPFWIKDRTTPVWTGNIAYDMRVFRTHPELRFDHRFDRVGEAMGGGEDAAMFASLLALGVRIRYQPEMLMRHFVEPSRLKPGYFLRLHYMAGVRRGQYQLPQFSKKLFGVPPFLLGQFLRQSVNTAMLALRSGPAIVRQAMNAAHALGLVVGYAKRNPVQVSDH